MKSRAEQIADAAEEFSEEQFKDSDSFSVMKNVCNDSIWHTGFTCGAEWADKNPNWIEKLEHDIALLNNHDYSGYELSGIPGNIVELYTKQKEQLTKAHEVLAIAREALEYCAQDYCDPGHNYETGPSSVIDYFDKAREALAKIQEAMK